MDSDPLSILIKLALIMLLVLLNGFFVSVEFAMVKVRRSRVDALVEEGSKNAASARHILNNLTGYLSACQLGITLSSLALGWLGQPVVAAMLNPVFQFTGMSESVGYGISLGMAFLFIVILHIVLGELAPKTIALRKAEKILLLSTVPIRMFYRIMYPFIWLLNGLANALLSVFGVDRSDGSEAVHTEEEIRILMKESSENGMIDSNELRMVDNIFEFAATTAREVMIPRTEMICLYTHHTLDENLEIAIEGTRTRYPVCEQDKDHIIGFIHIKDLIQTNSEDYRDLLRPIMAVPESLPISELMKRMQRNKTQIAILIDEYGGTSGLVTLEDIVEEIVGEIQDEFDEERPIVEALGDDQYSIDGLMLIETANDRFGLELDTDDFDTIGGWLYSHIEVLPPYVGQTVQFDNRLFIVEETDHKRISRVKMLRQNIVSFEEAGA